MNQSKGGLAYLGLGMVLPFLVQSTASLICFQRFVGEGFAIGAGIAARLLGSMILAIPLIVSFMLARSIFSTLGSKVITIATATSAFAILASLGAGFAFLAAQVETVTVLRPILFSVLAVTLLPVSWFVGRVIAARSEMPSGVNVASLATALVAVAAPVSLGSFFQVFDAVRSCQGSDSWGLSWLSLAIIPIITLLLAGVSWLWARRLWAREA